MTVCFEDVTPTESRAHERLSLCETRLNSCEPERDLCQPDLDLGVFGFLGV